MHEHCVPRWLCMATRWPPQQLCRAGPGRAWCQAAVASTVGAGRALGRGWRHPGGQQALEQKGIALGQGWPRSGPSPAGSADRLSWRGLAASRAGPCQPCLPWGPLESHAGELEFLLPSVQGLCSWPRALPWPGPCIPGLAAVGEVLPSLAASQMFHCRVLFPSPPPPQRASSTEHGVAACPPQHSWQGPHPATVPWVLIPRAEEEASPALSSGGVSGGTPQAPAPDSVAWSTRCKWSVSSPVPQDAAPAWRLSFVVGAPDNGTFPGNARTCGAVCLRCAGLYEPRAVTVFPTQC